MADFDGEIHRELIGRVTISRRPRALAAVARQRVIPRLIRHCVACQCVSDVRRTPDSGARDGVIGRPSLWIAEEFWVLRFRLMVKRGPW